MIGFRIFDSWKIYHRKQHLLFFLKDLGLRDEDSLILGFVSEGIIDEFKDLIWVEGTTNEFVGVSIMESLLFVSRLDLRMSLFVNRIFCT